MNKLLASAAQSGAADLAERGVEVRYSPDGQDFFRLTIRPAGAGNEAMLKGSADAVRPYVSSGVPADKLDVKIQRLISAKLMAQHVVIGWNEEDFGAPYSRDAVEETLKADPNFAVWLENASNDQIELRRLFREQNAGN